MSNISLKTMTFPALWTVLFLLIIMPWPEYDAYCFLASMVLLITSVVVQVLKFPSTEKLSIPKSPLLLCLGGFWGVALISTLASEIPFTSLIYLTFLSTLFLSFILVSLAKDKDQIFPMLLTAAALVFAGMAISSLIQYFFFFDMLYNGLVNLPMANPNSLGAFFSIGFFGAYGAMNICTHRRQKTLFAILCVLILGAIITTGSRGALVALIAGLGAFHILGWSQLKKNTKWQLGTLLGVILLTVVLVKFAPSENYQDPLDIVHYTIGSEQTIYPGRSLFGNRWDIWKSTWQIIQDHFWTGIGIGTFFLYYPEVRDGDLETAGFMVHNDPLHFWVEMGVFAPILFYLALGFTMFKTFQALAKTEKNDPRRIKILTPCCAIGAMVVHSHISFNFYVLPMLFLTGTYLAYWFWNVQSITPDKPLPITHGSSTENTLLKFCLIAPLLCLCFFFVTNEGSEILVKRAKAKLQVEKNMAGFIREINWAIDLSFNRNARAMALYATIPSSFLRSPQGQEIPIGEKRKLFREARAFLNKSTEENPRMASLYHEKAILAEYGLNNFSSQEVKMDSPISLLEKSLKLDPLHANTRLQLANVLIADGQEERAFKVLKDGLKWPYLNQTPIPYWRTTAAMANKFGDPKTQARALEKIRIHNILYPPSGSPQPKIKP